MTITAEQQAKIDNAVETLRPEARELLNSFKGQIKTTKDNYGNVMSFLSHINSKTVQILFLRALVKEGYPAGTASQVASLMGI